jgi:hypothetical protein
MRVTKTFEIEGNNKSFTIKELKVKQIIRLMSEDNLDTDLEAMKKNLSEVFLPMCSNIKFEDLEDLAPSELRTIWDHFKEVNKSFFELAQKMGLEKIVNQVKVGIQEDFSNLLANSSSQDTQES